MKTMKLDVQNHPDDPVQLKEIIVSLASEAEHRIEYLEEMIRLLKNEIFGRKSEKRSVVDSRQFLLFDNPETEDQSTDRQQPPISISFMRQLSCHRGAGPDAGKRQQFGFKLFPETCFRAFQRAICRSFAFDRRSDGRKIIITNICS
jgi:hypothetical protein